MIHNVMIMYRQAYIILDYATSCNRARGIMIHAVSCMMTTINFTIISMTLKHAICSSFWMYIV